MPPSNKKLDEIHVLVRENNKMLHKMRRDAFWGFIFKIIMWVVILGVPLYFYLTIFQPLLTELLDTLEQVKTTGQNVQGTGAEFALRLQEIGEYFRGFWGVKE